MVTLKRQCLKDAVAHLAQALTRIADGAR